MKLLRMKTGHRCFIYSAAMLLDETPETLMKELGHDGMIIAWPDLQSPKCFRGVHIQEVQDLCLRRGKLLAAVEIAPRIGYDSHHWTRIYNDDRETPRFLGAISGRPGLITGVYQNTALPQDNHCVAWDGERIFDPNDKITRLEQFSIQTAWVLCDASRKRSYPAPERARSCRHDFLEGYGNYCPQCISDHNL